MTARHLLCACFVFMTPPANGSASANLDRAGAEAAVIIELLKSSPSAQVVVVDLRPSEVANIKKVAPILMAKLVSKEEHDVKQRNQKELQTPTAEFSVKVVETRGDRAIVLGGTPFISLSGSRDRFTLQRIHGRWRIIKREPYEIA